VGAVQDFMAVLLLRSAPEAAHIHTIERRTKPEPQIKSYLLFVILCYLLFVICYFVILL
jgi:hypothetical protein